MAMKIEESRVSGSRYYTIDPDVIADEPFWYHQDWYDMEKWCKATFGDTPKDGVWTPNARWYMNNSKFWFKEKKDLEWFVIRWS